MVLELGLFPGLIVRNKVRALIKGKLERPSDFDRVVYTHVDEAGAWKYKLAKEQQAAGFDIDLNQVR